EVAAPVLLVIDAPGDADRRRGIGGPLRFGGIGRVDGGDVREVGAVRRPGEVADLLGVLGEATRLAGLADGQQVDAAALAAAVGDEGDLLAVRRPAATALLRLGR